MDKKKTFDVTKPGKSSPHSTARPIIVSNRSIVKDPTLKQGDESEDPEVADKDSVGQVSNQAKTLEPIVSDGEVTDKPPEPKDETDKVETEKDEKPSAELTETEPELDQTINDNKKANKQEAEDEAHQEMVDKLVAEGKYIVPIGQVKRRRDSRNTLMLLALLLIVGVITLNLLIDIGVIETNIKPVVDLIKN